ncbi:MFS family permease [Robertmurraya andreesenii]|uniref:MFS family permease n=1 Tax=Anoxybacillus andreesenii TaxID=1325932 RepID=A0ABT9V0Q6_9BACL|nr:MFS family permease [Robertmurraya andreesenii]
MFLIGFTANIWLLFLFTIIFTFGEIVRSPVLNNFISGYASPSARGQYMGASRLQFTVGRFLAPITVFLSEWIHPIGIFGIILCSALIGGACYVLLYKMYKPETNSI